MRQYITYILGLALMATACDNENISDLPQADSAVSFQVRTVLPGGEEGEPQSAERMTRLFVAERPQEHTEPLHCAPEMRFTLTDNIYNLSGLYGQWYKFAFISVPQWENGGGENLFTEENPEEKTCDFTKLLVDFSPVLEYQKNNPGMVYSKDLHIYRKNIDRWIHPDEPSVEDVEMKRITGELIIDMGKPADQFEMPVNKIGLNLKNPNKQVYVRDEANAEVITTKGSGSDFIYELLVSLDSNSQYQRQYLILTLLPEELNGEIIVYHEGTNEVDVFKIGGDEGFPISIKPNVRTTVLFNGMDKDQFEVRYAGFNDGDDAVIDVPDNGWNGWQ